LENLHRDRQIQKAQIHSLQQREETLKHKLIADLEKDLSTNHQDLFYDFQQLQLQHRNHLSVQDIFHFLIDKLYYYVHASAAASSAGRPSSYEYDRKGANRRSASPPAKEGELNNNTSISYGRSGGTAHQQNLPPRSSQSQQEKPMFATTSLLNEKKQQQPSFSSSFSQSRSLSGESKYNKTGSSSTTVAALNPLQERLRKAQAAFASMKENTI
jgi:hypothetical protein